jgi:hypothetical protein
MRLSKSLATIGIWVTCACTALLLAPAARADYGGGAAKNTWQIEISFNCNNASLCGDIFGGTGGFWLWGELDQTVGANPTYTGDAEATFCFHDAAAHIGGAGHTAEDIASWMVGDDGTFWITGGTDTDRFRGQVFIHPIFADAQFQPDPDNPTVYASPSTPSLTGVPALPGTYHYDTADIWGVSAPGVSATIEVAYRPAR